MGAIRRLIQEKDEQDRGMGREKDAARQRRKMQERSAAEVKAIEQTRALQLARKRDDAVLLRKKTIATADREMAQTVKKYQQEIRAVEVRRREEKDVFIEELWTSKREARELTEQNRNLFVDLEVVRDRVTRGKEDARAEQEKRDLDAIRETAAKEKEDIEARTAKTHKDMLTQWKVDALERAQQFRENDRKESYREVNRKKKEEDRLRRFRETQFLDTLRGRNMTQRQSEEQPE